MKYLCLVYLDAEHWNTCPDTSCDEYARHVAGRQQLLAAEPLHAVHTATTLRVRNAQVMLTDGPFAETKEQLAGFYMIEARDLNEAIQIASKIPPARVGCVEVRPIRPIRETVAARAQGQTA